MFLIFLRMNPLNIILLSIGSHGDVHPMVGIGQRLKQRGHSVTLIANGHFESLARSAGLAFDSIGTHEEFLQIASDKDLWHPRKGSLRVLQLVLENLRLAYDTLVRHIQPGKTLVAATSMGMAARIAADKWHFPMATVHLSPICFRSVHEMPRLPNSPDLSFLPRWAINLLWKSVDRFMLDPVLTPQINAFRAELGLPPISRVMHDWWGSPDCIIGAFPEWFATPAPDWPAQTVLTDFPRYDEQDLQDLSPDLLTFLNDGPPVIAFTPGSAMVNNRPWFDAAVQACQTIGQRGLLLTRHVDQIPPNLPATIRHEPYAPFSRLLPHCAAVVHHGGIGSTSQALAAGIPQLVVAMAHDQYDNGHRLTKRGLGRIISGKHISAKAMAKALVQLPPLRPACQKIADRLRPIDGQSLAADAIESLANRL